MTQAQAADKFVEWCLSEWVKQGGVPTELTMAMGRMFVAIHDKRDEAGDSK